MNRTKSKRVLRYREGVATPEEREQVEAWIDESPDVRRTIESDVQIRRVVRENVSQEFQPFFEDRVMRRLKERERRSPRFSIGWFALPPRQMAWAGVAIALILALAYLLLLRPTGMHHLAVPHGETAVVTLHDGSEVNLAAGTHLTYPRRFGDERAVQLRGEAYFSVAADERPFRVDTENARVLVRGTAFNVRAWPGPAGETQVALETGDVEVSLRRDPANVVRLAPGQMTVASGDTTLRRPQRASLEHVLAWRRGGIAFNDMPLEHVVAELERRFDVQIAVADAHTARRHVTYLEPAPRSVQLVLEDICQVLGLEYRRTARGFIVSAQ